MDLFFFFHLNYYFSSRKKENLASTENEVTEEKEQSETAAASDIRRSVSLLERPGVLTFQIIFMWMIIAMVRIQGCVIGTKSQR